MNASQKCCPEPPQAVHEVAAVIRFAPGDTAADPAAHAYSLLAQINAITAALPDRVAIKLGSEPATTFMWASQHGGDPHMTGGFSTPEEAAAYAAEHDLTLLWTAEPAAPAPPYGRSWPLAPTTGLSERITLDSDQLRELGLMSVGDDAQEPATEVRLLLEEALQALTTPAGLRAGVEGDDGEEDCMVRLSLIGPDGLEASGGWEEVRGSTFTGPVLGAVQEAVAQLNDLLDRADPRRSLHSEPATERGRGGLALGELGELNYLKPDERYVVSLIVGYAASTVTSPEHALAAALELTRDGGSDDTLWTVHDRLTGATHTLEQGDLGRDLPHIDDADAWRERSRDAG